MSRSLEGPLTPGGFCKNMRILIDMRLAIALVIAVLSGCSSLSVEEGLNRVKTGMDKGSVLELVGNPKRTFRMDSKDTWIYTFYKSEREYVRSVTFENGRVLNVTTTHVLRAPSDENDHEETLEQVEDQLRELNKGDKGVFKDVDSD